MLNNAEKIFTWTDTSCKFMQGIIKDKDKVKLVSPGIDTNIFTRSDGKEYQPNGVTRFLMVGKMKPCKDHQTLLKALRYIKEKRDVNIEATLLGRGRENFTKKLKDQIEDLGLEDLIKIVESVPHEKISEFYNNYDVLILPSKSEAVGMVVPEAMACGLPAIVSDSVGAKYYVIKGQTGFIFKTGDYKDLAKKMIEITKADIKDMGDKTLSNMKDNYDINKTSEEFYNFLK